MKCPFCGNLDTQVVETRLSEDGDSVRRRRQCGACDRRYTTYERPDVSFPNIVKKDGVREVPSTRIGELVMRELKKLDKVAYIRFASVYRSFEDIDEFRNLVDEVSK